MLVEDEEDIRTIAQFSLEKIGKFTVLCCASGTESIQSVIQFSPDLILLDMMMPEMDGIMTLKALKMLPSIEKIPIVFMTAKVQKSEIEQYKSLGAVDVIAKPFDPIELPKTLNMIWINYRDDNN